MKKYIFPLLSFLYAFQIAAQEIKSIVVNDTLTVKAKLLYSDDFNKDLSKWIPQFEKDSSYVALKNGKLEINSKRGCTVWYDQNLEAPLMIEYDAVMVDKGGKYDRVSDLNCFWMASDPVNPNDFYVNIKNQKGGLGDYNYLKLYYVGFGGRNNSTTRLRRYPGDGTRPMLPEHDLQEPKYLIQGGNVVNHIKIINYKGVVQYYRNNQLIFNFYDTEPLTSGYFGIRTTINHMTVDNFKVYSLNR